MNLFTKQTRTKTTEESPCWQADCCQFFINPTFITALIKSKLLSPQGYLKSINALSLYFLISILILPTHLRLGLPRSLLNSWWRIHILNAFLISLYMLCIPPISELLDLITTINLIKAINCKPHCVWTTLIYKQEDFPIAEGPKY
jgi:hypothetical protein